ncbi:MAG: PVC-type heme-binding CxxCH protein [Planctomycetota bacterium]
MIRLATPALILILAQSALAQRNFSGTVETDPEKERATFKMSPGLEANLFAADPLLAKPIQMSWDIKGRLWVACSETYPQIKPGESARDKILVLEDTNGDGKADKTTVFADGLLIPTGVEPAENGAYVVDSTDLVFLEDTNGDGKADRRTVVLSGFGTEDTHHMVHTVRWHFDGRLHFNQSIYIHSHIETPHGPRRLGGSGIWRFHPPTQRLEVVQRGLVNPWGHHHDRFGQSFATDGAGGEGINFVVPRAYYATAVGAKRVLPGLNPGSPKHCGLELVFSRAFPDYWQGDAITCDFRGHRVCRFKLSDDGSGFISREQTEVIKSDHPAFRPIDVRMGPDGALYIADWFNPIIQHGEVDFRDPRRDKTHGRIWRVTASGRAFPPRNDHSVMSPQALVGLLGEPEQYTRHQARRALVERGLKASMPALESATSALPKGPATPIHLDMLWAWQSFDIYPDALLDQVLHAEDPRIRAAGVRVLVDDRERKPNALERIGSMVTDTDPRVRLEAIRALGQFTNQPKAASLALKARALPTDRWLDYSLWLTLDELAPSWLTALDKGEWGADVSVDDLLFSLQAVGAQGAAGRLAGLVKLGKVDARRLPDVLASIAQDGGPPEAALVLETINGSSFPKERISPVLESLVKSAISRGVRVSKAGETLNGLMGNPSRDVRASAMKLAGAWKDDSLVPALIKAIKDADNMVRSAAIEGLGSAGTTAATNALVEAVRAKPENLRELLVALVSADAVKAAPEITSFLAGASPDDAKAVVDAVLSRKGASVLVAKSLSGTQVPTDSARLALRSVTGSGQDHGALRDALQAAGRLGLARKGWTTKEKNALLASLPKADPARGESIYRARQLQCLNCHAIGGSGGLVGPDMTSIGASAQPDYLLESLLEPSAKIKEGYHTAIVSTDDGKIITGVKIRQNDAGVMLRLADGAEVTVPKGRIEEIKDGKSLMPEGLADTLTDRELTDLVRFLSELGKSGPYAPVTRPVIRTWQALEDSPAARAWLGRASQATPPANLKWRPAYSMVSGELPLDDLPLVDGKAILRLPPAPAGMGRARIDINGAPPADFLANGKGKLAPGGTLPPGSLILVKPASSTRVRAEWQPR